MQFGINAQIRMERALGVESMAEKVLLKETNENVWSIVVLQILVKRSFKKVFLVKIGKIKKNCAIIPEIAFSSL